MRRVVISSVTVVVTLLQANELSAQQVPAIPHARSVDRSLAFMQVYGPALAPQGFLRFCEESPEDCRAKLDWRRRRRASTNSTISTGELID